MRRYYTIIGVMALLVGVLACEWTASQEGFQMLHAAQTGEEEAAAFERIVASGSQITFAPYDEEGNPLDMAQLDWWEDLHHIRLIVGPYSTDHEMIDPENIFILMRE
jgi:hypothetical protein